MQFRPRETSGPALGEQFERVIRQHPRLRHLDEMVAQGGRIYARPVAGNKCEVLIAWPTDQENTDGSTHAR